MPNYMYVSLQDDDKISVFAMDSETGTLTPKSETPAAGGPSASAISPNRKTLYVALRNSNEIASYRFLLSSYYQGAHVAVHPIGDDGSVSDPPIEWLETATAAHAIQTDRSNKFAFVPHIARLNDSVMLPPGDALGPNTIFQFRFDETSGRLTPNTPLKVEPNEFLGPRHLCFHPNLDVVYFSDEQGSSVTAYNLDSSTGTLSAFQTITTLPEGFSGRNTCSQIQISPSGKFLYTPNRGHNSIAGFSVDSLSGRLTAVGRVSTESVPSAFSLDPEGNFVFAAGSESGRLASYRVNADTGELTPLETYTAGNRPMGVLITNMGG